MFSLFTNGSFSVRIDDDLIERGNVTDFWAILPPTMVDDNSVTKPVDWIDDEFMDDPTAEKPKDWTDITQIPDPDATTPEDWDESEDGKWESPIIPNPDYKGPWVPPKITILITRDHGCNLAYRTPTISQTQALDITR